MVRPTRLLVTVKTYPIISKKYIELVCTAGLKEDGSWVRIYPAPFRFIEATNQYRKYQWINLKLERNPKDKRPESYRPLDIDSIELGDEVPTGNDWFERRQLVLKSGQIFHSLNDVIELAKANKLSLATFKPTEILDVVIEKHRPLEDIQRREFADALRQQGSLFKTIPLADVDLMPRLPFKFKIKFLDKENRQSSLLIEDWEIGQLFLNLRRSKTETEAALGVKSKIMQMSENTDLHFFLGTTLQWHFVAPNPFIIVGLFYPPIRKQMELF